jgi:hypothetical protein
MPETAAPPEAAPSRATAQTTTPPASALDAGGVAGRCNEELDNLFRDANLDDLFRIRNSVDGWIIEKLAEANRQETFRDDGATSPESWAVERFGVSVPTARALTQVAENAGDLPNLTGALRQGEITFDKLRAVADVARPETERELLEAARECTVRQLADAAGARRSVPKRGAGAEQHDRRFLRFNDLFRTISIQLPPDSYAETKTAIEAQAKEIPSDGETPWDQRCCDAFMEKIRSSWGTNTTASPYFVVVHAPLAALVDDADESTELAGELEHHGLIDCDMVRRIACDATIAVGVDDDVGHTMYEGRARRFPTQSQRREVMRRDRHCRFPGCTNVTFTNVHHIKPWGSGGRTDLENLVLTCLHHHGLVHRKGWTMSGNANEELTIVGPNGRVTTSRPSRIWTAVTDPAATRAAGPPAGRATPKG